MRVRTKRPTDTHRRAPGARPRLLRRDAGSVAPPPAPEPPAPASEPVAQEDDGLADERRLRESGGPLDRAQYSCSCGFVWWADVTASVACPHCGAGQAW